MSAFQWKREVLDFTHHEHMRERMGQWLFFVIRHRQPANLVVHFFAVNLYFGGIFGFLATFDPRWFLGGILSSVIASPSHYYFDDGIVSPDRGEGILTRYVPIYVASIYFMLLRGTYWPEVEKAEARYREVMAELAAEGIRATP